jgi:hypothetical protein
MYHLAYTLTNFDSPLDATASALLKQKSALLLTTYHAVPNEEALVEFGIWSGRAASKGTWM